MTLKAGTYVFSAYFKAATADKAGARLGYVPIGDDGIPGSYVYDADYVNDITNTDWVTKKLHIYFDWRAKGMFGCYES